MKKSMKAPLVAAMSTAAVAMLASSAVSAASNPFGINELSSGYMQVAAAENPESKPAPKKNSEASCGAMMNESKSGEMACGAQMGGMPKEQMEKAQEGSCGGKKTQEAGCGAMMNKDKASGK